MTLTPTMRNAIRWLIAILVALAIGSISAMTDAHAGGLDYLRHGLLACVPTLLALKATLEKELGVAPSDPPKP